MITAWHSTGNRHHCRQSHHLSGHPPGLAVLWLVLVSLGTLSAEVLELALADVGRVDWELDLDTVRNHHGYSSVSGAYLRRPGCCGRRTTAPLCLRIPEP